MGLFGRRTIKAGPFRVTVSKSGVSKSFGGKRGRVRIDAKGRIRKSINFGRGFRWTK